MKIITIAALAALCLVGVYQLGARSMRPDLTLTATEELSMMRAEVALQSAQHAAVAEKDPVKAKALADARDIKQKNDLAIAEGIRKSHRCETCIIHWYLETDGSLKLETQPPVTGGK